MLYHMQKESESRKIKHGTYQTQTAKMKYEIILILIMMNNCGRWSGFAHTGAPVQKQIKYKETSR